MKRKSLSSKQPKVFRMPGEDLEKKIQTGKPIFPGYYMCYIKPEKKDAMDHWNMPELKVVRFTDIWQNLGIILGWIGPLPYPSVDELEADTRGVTYFFIGTKERAQEFDFDSGPYYRPIELACTQGGPNQFAFEVHSRKTKPKAIKKWNPSKGKWIKLK